MNSRLRFSTILTGAVLGVAACNPNGAPTTVTKSSAPVVTHKPSVRPTPSPTPKPVGAETNDPGSAPPVTPTPSGAAVSPSPSPSPVGTFDPKTPVIPPQEPLAETDKNNAVVTGRVFDIDGNQMVHKGINVTFHPDSGGADRKFDCDDPDSGGQGDGSYLSKNDFPPGIYTVTAVGYGYTPRTRRVNIQKGFKTTVDFGKPGDPDACFALSDFPEITSVDVGGDPTKVDNTKLHFVIHVSEPLSDAMKSALEADLRVVPINDVAGGVGKAQPDITTQDPVSALVTDFSYNIPLSGGRYYGQSSNNYGPGVTLSGHWAADKDFTFDWAIPLLDGASPGVYALALVSPGKDASGQEHKVVDISSALNQMGMDDKGDHSKWPDANHFVDKVFLDPNMGPPTFQADSAQHRWMSTHTNVFKFTLKPDAKPPVLNSVTAEVVRAQPAAGQSVGAEISTLISLTFDKMLCAFGPGGVVNAKTVNDPANYSFAVGINTDYLSTVFLDGVSNVLSEPLDKQNFGTDLTAELGKEFKFVPPSKADAASLTVALKPDIGTTQAGDPRVVQLILTNPNFFFHDDPCYKTTNVKAIKARVVNIQDANGNAIPTSVANGKTSQPTAAITYHPSGACPP